MSIFGVCPHAALECICFCVTISNFKNVFTFSIVKLVYRKSLSIYSKFSRGQKFNMPHRGISPKQIKNYNLKDHWYFLSVLQVLNLNIFFMLLSTKFFFAGVTSRKAVHELIDIFSQRNFCKITMSFVSNNPHRKNVSQDTTNYKRIILETFFKLTRKFCKRYYFHIKNRGKSPTVLS